MFGFFVLASAATVQFFTGNDLYQFCKSNSSADRAFCYGFVSGVADTERAIDSYRKPPVQHICIDDTVVVDQVRGVVIRYMEQFPEKRNYSAASIASDALERAFPCK